MSKSSVPCKRAMRSLGLSWDGIRPKHGILLGRMSTGVERACCEHHRPWYVGFLVSRPPVSGLVARVLLLDLIWTLRCGPVRTAGERSPA